MNATFAFIIHLPLKKCQGKLSFLDSKFKTTSLTFRSVTPQNAVSSCRTYGRTLDCCLPAPFFNLTASLSASRCSPKLAVSNIPFRGKTGFLLPLLVQVDYSWQGQANVPHRLIPTRGSTSETKTQAFKTVTQQNFPLWRKQCSIWPLAGFTF